MDWLSYLFPRRVARFGSVHNKHIAVVRISGKNILLVNDIQQTGPYTEKLWKIGLKPILNRPLGDISNILVFGVGGGTVFHLFRKQFPKARIIGVDIDREIITIAKKYFGLDSLDNVSLICADAQRYTRGKENFGKYDLVIVDLYIANDVPNFVTEQSFLSGINRLLRPGGSMVMNYFSERAQNEKARLLQRKLSTIFRSVETNSVLRNIFVYVVK